MLDLATHHAAIKSMLSVTRPYATALAGTMRASAVDATGDHKSCSAASRRMDMCSTNSTFPIATSRALISPSLFSIDFRQRMSLPLANEGVALDAVQLYWWLAPLSL